MWLDEATIVMRTMTKLYILYPQSPVEFSAERSRGSLDLEARFSSRHRAAYGYRTIGSRACNPAGNHDYR
jgi:hypothetical protein